MKKIIIVILLVVIAILAIALFRTTLEESTSSTPTVRDSSSLPPDDSPDEPVDVQEFDQLFTEDWEHAERATKAIQELAPGQVITGSIVEDPLEEEIVYFAASAFDQEKQENLVSIYKYNESDYSWERLYRSTYGAGDFSALDDSIIPAFYVVGYDSGKLILLVKDLDDSPGPCTMPLLLGAEQGTQQHGDSPFEARTLVSMDISDPYSGLDEYRPSEDALAEQTQLQEGCLRDL